MEVYVFKIATKNNPEVFREIQIPAHYNFEDFHHSILDAFEVPAGEMASFYTSDASYYKGLEITLMDMNVMEEEAVNLIMRDHSLKKFVEEGIAHFVYHYDFLFLKAFTLELLKIFETDKEEVLLLNTQGSMPMENKQMEDFLMEDLDEIDLPEDMKSKNKGPNSKTQDPYDFLEGYDDEDEDDFERFENIDDLDI